MSNATAHTDPPDPFAVGSLRRDVEHRAVRGLAATLASHGIRALLHLGSTAILARLLTPEDYGLFGMVAILTGFVALVNDLGLTKATIQRDEITHEQISTLFWINTLLSGCLSAVVAATAPLLAWVYSEPQLVALTLAVAPSLLLTGLSAQHSALVRRQMRFTALAVIGTASFVSALAASIALAAMGAGVWALVGLALVRPVVQGAALWAVVRWIPGPPVRGSGVRDMLRFGGNISGFRVVNYLSRNLDNALIGWYWGAAPLGIYTRAYAIFMAPLSTVMPALGHVAEPALSRLQSVPARYAQAYHRALEGVSWITMPIATVLAIAAAPTVDLLLGNQWTSVVPVFQLLCIGAVVQPVMNSSGWVFTSLGRGHEMLRWGIFSALCHCVTFAIALPFGPIGVAFGVGVLRLLLTPVALHLASRGTDFSLRSVLRHIAVPLATCLTSGAAAWLALEVLSPAASTLGVLLVATIVCGACTLVILVTRRLSDLKQIYSKRLRGSDEGSLPVRTD